MFGQLRADLKGEERKARERQVAAQRSKHISECTNPFCTAGKVETRIEMSLLCNAIQTIQTREVKMYTVDT